MNDITWGGVLTTAGDVVFSGGKEGYFFALDARTGALLWKAALGGQVNSGPMSYAVDGKQYVDDRRRQRTVRVRPDGPGAGLEPEEFTMTLNRREFMCTSPPRWRRRPRSSFAVRTGAGGAAGRAGVHGRPPQRRHLHRPRRHDRLSRHPRRRRRRRQPVRRHGADVPRRPEAEDVAQDRLPDQLAPSRRPHRRQQGDAAVGGEDRRARQRAGPAAEAAAAQKTRGQPGVRGHDVRQGLEGDGRQGDRVGAVLRAGAHRRRHRHHLRAAPTSCTWAT